MALATGTSPRAHRLIGLAAVLLLAVTTALAFGRVFLGAATTFRLLGTAVAAACLAVAFERRSLLLSTLASAAGLTVAVALLVFPGTTWYGLPTGDTMRAALDAAAVVGQQARIQVAPAEPIAPLLLAAIISLWAALFSAHALAFRAGSPLLGLIPPVALVAFADTVLEEFVKPLYGVAFLAAALLVVFADGLARVQGWGPVWSSARRGVAATAGHGARRLAIPALAVAALAPIVVPGFGSKAVIDLGTPAEDRVSIDPFVSVKSSLSREEPVEVLRVTVSRPTYIRLVSLPDFDGATWSPVLDEGSGVAGEPDAAAGGIGGVAETVGFEVTTDTRFPWLPTVYPVRSVEAPGTSLRVEPESGTVFLDSPPEAGDTYAVQTAFVQPTDDALRQAGSSGLEAGGRYLELPDMPDRIGEIARAWTRGAPTDFDKAIAIQDHLRDTREFTYDESAPARSGTRTILEFLDNTKAGFCQQFAASMAVLLRELGIESRVVVGFATGTRMQGGRYSYSTRQAHSWVEVFFPGWGWMPFEPTPNRENPVTEAYDAPEASTCIGTECPDGGFTPPEVTASGRDAQRDAFERLPRAAGPRGRAGGPGTFETPVGAGGRTGRTLLLLGLAIAGLALLLAPPAKALLRRARLRRVAAEPRRLILITYEQFSEQVAGLGLGRGPGQTFEEYRRSVMDTGYLADGHLDRLTRIATAAAYSAREPGADDARAAGEASTTALREIRRAVGPTRWLAGLYRRR